MFLIKNMFKKMIDIWLYVCISTDRISLVIEIWHQSSYNRNTKRCIHLWHRPTQHSCRACFTIWTTDGYREKSLRNFSNKLIVSQTSMIMFFRRVFLIFTRLCNLRTIDNRLYIRINYEIVKIYLVVSMSNNHLQSMAR